MKVLEKWFGWLTEGVAGAVAAGIVAGGGAWAGR